MVLRIPSLISAVVSLAALLGAGHAWADDPPDGDGAPAAAVPAEDGASTDRKVVASELPPGVADRAATEEPLVLRYPPTSVRIGLITGGLGLTLGAYGASLGAAYGASDIPGIDKLKIPVIGPWWSLAESGCPEDDPECGASLYLRGVAYVLDGLFQLGGLGIAAEGIFMTTEAEPQLPTAEVSLVPIARPDMLGLGAVGTF